MLASNRKIPEEKRIEGQLETFVELISSELLGIGFGTGECILMGKFTLNLETGDLYDIELNPEPDFRKEYGWVFSRDEEK